MSETEDALNWVTIANWHRAHFIGLSNATGLFRARLNGETKFIGHSAKGGLGPRLGAYRRRKSSEHHHAGRLIYEHRREITMQIVIMDAPAGEILELLDKMLGERKPPWNVQDGHYRDI